MSVLHTINKSPFSFTILKSFVSVCGMNDGLLLLEDGVFGALDNAITNDEQLILKQKNIKIYALSPDVIARGIEKRISKHITLISYDDFVQLTLEHQNVHSWF